MKFKIGISSGDLKKYEEIILCKYNLSIEGKSKRNYEYSIEINNLEELMQFIKEVNQIKDSPWIKNGILIDNGYIEIYDDYIE